MVLRSQTVIVAAILSFSPLATSSDGWARTLDRSSTQPQAKEPQPGTRPDPPPADGFWPTPKLLDLMLRRTADDLGSSLELDDEQRPRFRDAAAKRWGQFLTDGRAWIQPLFTEFLEMRMSFDPPTKTQLQAWAGRALPVFRSVRQQIDQGTDDLRDILKPEQRAKFELRRLKLAAGLAYAEAKLTLAESGQITEDDLREFWQPTRAERDQDDDHQEAGEAVAVGAEKPTAPPTPRDVIAEELAAWTDYVDTLMRTYGFDDGQRDAALSFLSELRQRALTHRDTRREEIVRLEERIARFDGAETELAELKKQLAELYGPIDTMFAELKRRVGAIPTAQQRAAVASRVKAPAATEPPAPPTPKP